MRVLVTGVSGFSGSYVARALCRAGHDVVGTHRRESPFMADLAELPGFRSMQAELSAANSVPGPFDAVVHIAATSPAPGKSIANIVRDNVVGTMALAEMALRWDSRAFIFFSSLSLYGEIGAGVVDEQTAIVNPDAYGSSKHLCELALAEISPSLPCLSLRLPGVLGRGAHRNWLSGVAAKLQRGEPVRAFHLASPFNNAVHIDDVARLTVDTVSRSFDGFDAIVLGARGSLAVREIIERLARGLGATAIIETGTPAKPSFTLSSQRAIERWGYDPMDIGAMVDRYASEVL